MAARSERSERPVAEPDVAAQADQAGEGQTAVQPPRADRPGYLRTDGDPPAHPGNGTLPAALPRAGMRTPMPSVRQTSDLQGNQLIKEGAKEAC
jgi:hypothetical protein